MTQHTHNWIAMALTMITVMLVAHKPIENHPLGKLVDSTYIITMVVVIIALWFGLP